ncbi:unnamed protein product [Jaminaea pallidilutea]
MIASVSTRPLPFRPIAPAHVRHATRRCNEEVLVRGYHFPTSSPPCHIYLSKSATAMPGRVAAPRANGERAAVPASTTASSRPRRQDTGINGDVPRLAASKVTRTRPAATGATSSSTSSTSTAVRDTNAKSQRPRTIEARATQQLLSPPEVAARFKTPSDVNEGVLASLLHHLDVDVENLRLTLLSKHITAQKGQRSGPSSLEPSRPAAHLAKDVVNACYPALATLCTSGWKAGIGAQPSTNNVFHFLDGYRAAIRVLFAARRQSASAEPSWQIHHVALAQVKRIAALEITSIVLEELAIVRLQIATAFGSECASEPSTSSLGPTLIALEQNAEQREVALTILVLDYLSFTLTQASESGAQLERLSSCDATGFIAAIEDADRGVRAWWQRGLEIMDSESPPPAHILKLTQRIPLVIERFLARLAQALVQQSSNDSESASCSSLALRCRTVGLVWLIRATGQSGDDTETAAQRRGQIIGRIGRMAMTHWRSQKDHKAAWVEINAALEEVHRAVSAKDATIEDEAQHWTATPEWAKVMEAWKWLATQSGCIDAAARVSSLLDGSSKQSSPSGLEKQMAQITLDASPPASRQRSKEEAIQTATDACTSLVVALDALRAGVPSVEDLYSSATLMTRATEALKEATSAVATESMDHDLPSSSSSAYLKVLDRLRRRCCAHINEWVETSRPHHPDTSPDFVSRSSRDLFAAVLSAEAQMRISLDTYSDSLVSTSAAYRSFGLTLYEANYTEESLQQLTKGVNFLDECGNLPRPTSIDVQRVLRQQYHMLSSTLYHIGGRIYAARLYAMAARFLRLSAVVGEKSQAGLTVDSELDAGTHQTSQNLCKRWEYTAACYRMLSRPREAMDALQRAVINVEPGIWNHLETLSARWPPQAIFDGAFVLADSTDSNSEDIRTNVVALTRMLHTLFEVSVFELLIDQASLSEKEDQCISAILGSSKASAGSQALCLEYLASSSWLESRMHCDGAEAASSALLDSALLLLDGHDAPLRKARILLRRLERLTLSGADDPEGRKQTFMGEVEMLLSLNDLDNSRRSPEALGLTLQQRLLQVLLVAQRARCGNADVATAVTKAVKAAARSIRDLIDVGAQRSAPAEPKRPNGVAAPSDSAGPSQRANAGSRTASASRPRSDQTAQKTASRMLGSRSAKKPLQELTAPAQRSARSKPAMSSHSVKAGQAAPAAPVTPPRNQSKAKAPAASNVRSEYESLPKKIPELLSSGHGRILSLLQVSCDFLSAYGHTLACIELLRCLLKLSGATDDDDIVRVKASIHLADQYMALGRYNRAKMLIDTVVGMPSDRFNRLTADVKCSVSLAHARFLSQQDSVAAASKYAEALILAGSLEGETDANKTSSAGLSRALEKVSRYSRIADAAATASLIQYKSGSDFQAIQAGLHCTSYAIRAASLLSKVTMYGSNESDLKSREQADVLEVPTRKSAAEEAAEAQEQSIGQSGRRGDERHYSSNHRLLSLTIASAHWRVSGQVIDALQRMAGLYGLRGSARDAETYATEAVDAAERSGFALTWAQSLLMRAEVRLQLHKKTDGEADVAQALQVLGDVWLPRAALLACLQGDQLARERTTHEEALRAYQTGQRTLRALNQAFSEIEQALPSSRRSASSTTPQRKASVPNSARSSSAKAKSRTSLYVNHDGLLPELHCRLIRRQALLSQMLGQIQESEDLTEEADTLEGSIMADDGDAHFSRGCLALEASKRYLRGDPVWAMLSEAAFSLPMTSSLAPLGAAASKRNVAPMDHRNNAASYTGVAAALASLSKAQSTFASLAETKLERSNCAATVLRQALVGLAESASLESLLSLQQRGTSPSNQSRQCQDTSDRIHQAMDTAAAITLDRESLQALWAKVEPQRGVNAIEKSAFLSLSASSALTTLSGAEKAAIDKQSKGAADRVARQPASKSLQKGSARAMTPSDHQTSDEEDDDEEGDVKKTIDQNPDKILQKYWQRKHASATRQTNDVPVEDERSLPSGWTVVTLSMSSDRKSLIVTRQSGYASLQPLVLSLPLDRQTRRESELDDDEVEDEDNETELLTMDAVLQELQDIVSSSNGLTSSARHVSAASELDQRKAWWNARRSLDDRLRLLCQNVEERWLGAFKSIFMDPLLVSHGSPAFENFRATMDSIIQRMCSPSGVKKGAHKVQLDGSILEMIAGLVPSNISDDEVEDLLHFIMDAHQFNGVPVAVDEADLDLLVIDVRSALEEFRSASARSHAAAKAPLNGHADHHLFLILDKDTAAIPWESIPALRGRAVCRIPSITFLHDRVEMAHLLGASQASDGAFHLSRDCKAFYLLNPSQDLVKSQERFENYLASKTNWRGIVGRAPGTGDFVEALEKYPLVLYFGHSGAEQYGRANKVRALNKCAVTMLWGCSSALLRDQGDFDRTGTPYNYMLAGSPAVVGQLFDATDKELDCISESVLLKLGLKETPSDELNAAKKASMSRKAGPLSSAAAVAVEDSGRKMSLARAVAESRDSCRLPYLTGAAPVCWGVPVYFDL